LIKAIALLHQYQKPIKESTRAGVTKHYIEVSLEDIELANRLADEVLGRSLDELPPHTRNFLDKIYLMVSDLATKAELQASEVRFTAKQAREHCGLSYEQTRFHLERLEKLEYVIIHRASQGNRYSYELLYDGRGKDGHKFMVGLLNLEQLRQGSATNSVTVEGNTTYYEEESTNSKGQNRAEKGHKQATYWRASTAD
jgi:DNA-binding transcriptional ArsR family regulator